MSRATTVLRSRTVAIKLDRQALKAFASLAVFGVAVGLAVGGLRSASLELNGYGLAPGLPAPYYLGLALLPLASGVEWLRGQRANGRLISLHVVAFVVIVWLTPLLLEGTPRFRTSYTNFGYVDPVLNGLGLIRDQFIYHNWPLFPVAAAEILRLGNISPYAAMAAFPLAAMLLYLVPVGAVLRVIANTDTPLQASQGTRWSLPTSALWPAGLWVFAVFNWTNQDYFSPQAVAFLIFLWWLLVLVRLALRRSGEVTVTDAALIVGLFSLIVLTHVLTSLEALGVLGALTLGGLVRRRTMLVTCALIFIVWQLNAAGPFFNFYADRLHASLFDISDFVEANVRSRVTGSPEHAHVALLRIATTGVVFALAGAATIGRLLKRPRSRGVLLGVTYGIGVAVVAPASLYGGEMMIRVLLFSLPLLGGLIVLALGWPLLRVALLGALIALAPLHIVTHYGNELHDYVSEGEIAGFEFVAAQLPPANLFGGYPAGNFLSSASLDPRNSYLSRGVTPSMLDDFLDPTRNHSWKHDAWPIYMLLGRGDEAALQLFQDRHGFIPAVKEVLDAEPSFTRLFENPDFAVYSWDRPPAAGIKEQLYNPPPTEPVALERRLFTLTSLALVLAMVLLEVIRGSRGRPSLLRYTSRAVAPLVACSMVVIGASVFRLAQIIGYF